MPMVDPFVADAFSTAALSDSINKIPNMYGRLNQLNLFPAKGVRTTSVIIEENNGVLTLLQTSKRGAPGQYVATAKRTARTLIVPHILHNETVLPQDVQDVRAFGSENQLKALTDLVMEKQVEMRNRHAITLEYLRCGALAGTIKDADASTIYNLFTEFGVSSASAVGDVGKYLTVDFALGDEDTDVISKTLDVKRHIEANLQGDVMTEVRGLCDSTFYDALTTHPNVKEAFKFFQQTQNLSGDYRQGFRYGGVVFEEYAGTCTDSSGTARPFIAAGKCQFFPVGTNNTFRTYFAPADYSEAVNTVGQELYSKMERIKFDKGWEIESQSNPLPVCLRPAVLVQGDDGVS